MHRVLSVLIHCITDSDTSRFVDKALGFALTWNYWFNDACSTVRSPRVLSHSILRLISCIGVRYHCTPATFTVLDRQLPWMGNQFDLLGRCDCPEPHVCQGLWRGTLRVDFFGCSHDLNG